MDTYSKDDAAEETAESPAEEAAESKSQEEMEAEAEAKKAEADAAIVERAMDCYRLGMDATADWREAALEDFEFLAGVQWETQVKAERDSQRRPALTINRLPQFVRAVTNEERQSKPAVTVTPVDSQGDTRTAEVLQGVIRNIEYTSNADAAYASGGFCAAVAGVGFWDVPAEYEDERSFEQRLAIRRITNPLSVVMDPSAKEVAGDDARWVLISTDISTDEWKAMHPDVDPPVGQDWSGRGNALSEWATKDGVRIHEYRWIDEEPDTLYDIRPLAKQLPELEAALVQADIDTSMGTVLASEVGEEFAARLEAAGLDQRPTTKRTARFAKIAGDIIIEQGQLAGRYLQVVRVVGTELDIDGKKIFEGVVRHAKDPQKALNFYVSAQTEAIALTPKAPWLAAEGQIEGYEGDWETANTRAHSVLTYKPTSIQGQPVPPPQRVMAEANIQAISQAIVTTNQQFSDTSGIYPTQFGAPSPEQSGRAILARQNQGQTSNFHFTDNFAMAIRFTGRILVDLIGKIYSGPRIMRILGEDEKPLMVPVNGQAGEYKGEKVGGQGGGKPIHLDAGRYDVAVSMGPSYLSRRQEAAAQMLELLRVVPQIGPAIPDLVVRSMDIPDGGLIADRLEKMLPPNIRPPDTEKQPPPAVLANNLQQAMAMNKQLIDHVNQLSQIIESKQHENASKERIANLNAFVELATTKAKLHSTDANAALDRATSLITDRLALVGIDAPAEDATPKQPAPEMQPPQPGQPMPPQGAPNGPPRPFIPGNAGPGPGGAPGVPGGFPGRGPIPGAGGPGGGFPGR